MRGRRDSDSAQRRNLDRAEQGLRDAQDALTDASKEKTNSNKKAQLELLAEEAEDLYVQLKMVRFRLDAGG
jgi:hypothetical protein